MGNCLVTTLKESVQNDNLLKIGEIRISVKPINNSYFLFEAPLSAGCKATIISGTGYFTVEGGDGTQYQEVELDIDKYLRITASTDVVVSINNSYAITRCYFLSSIYMADYKSFVKYANNLVNIMIEVTNGLNVNDISSTILRQVVMNFNAEGTLLSLIQKYDTTTPYKVINVSASNVSGDISDITPYLQEGATEINVASAYNITGSIEDFVRKMRIDAPNVSQISSFGIGGNVSFNGSVSEEPIYSDLSWTASTITYNGVTINA